LGGSWVTNCEQKKKKEKIGKNEEKTKEQIK
jgi:hypothetical protein